MQDILKQNITVEDFQHIKSEVIKDINPILREDFQTARFLKDIIFDFRVNYYNFLKWINFKFSPKKILYPASGFDIMPKIVFGKEKVVHTSLEKFHPFDNKSYFQDLGDAIKVVANNLSLPFENLSFQIIIVNGVSTDLALSWVNEMNRVLKVGGIVVVVQSILDEISIEKYLKSYNSLSIPCKFKKNDISETEFFLFKKCR